MKHSYPPSEADSSYGQEMNNYLQKAEIGSFDLETEFYDWQLEGPDTDERSAFCLEEWLASYDEAREEDSYSNPERYKTVLKALGAAALLLAATYLAGDAERKDLENRQEFNEPYYEDGIFNGEQFELDIINSIAEREGVHPEDVRLVSRAEAERLIAEDNG